MDRETTVQMRVKLALCREETPRLSRLIRVLPADDWTIFRMQHHSSSLCLGGIRHLRAHVMTVISRIRRP